MFDDSSYLDISSDNIVKISDSSTSIKKISVKSKLLHGEATITKLTEEIEDLKKTIEDLNLLYHQ